MQLKVLHKFLVLGSTLAVAVLVASRCKVAQRHNATLRGAEAFNTTKTIDYQRLFADDTIRITSLVGFCGNTCRKAQRRRHRRAVPTPPPEQDDSCRARYLQQAGNHRPAQDEGVLQAYCMREWVVSSFGGDGAPAAVAPSPTNEPGQVEPPPSTNLKITADFPANLAEIRFKGLYVFEAEVPNVGIKAGDGVPRTVRFKIVFGAMWDEHSHHRRWRRLPRKIEKNKEKRFRDHLAAALAHDHVVMFHGHIWGKSWGQQVLDPYTQALVGEVRALQGDKNNGGRGVDVLQSIEGTADGGDNALPSAENTPDRTAAIFYMNSCESESNEQAILTAMASKPDSDVILLSHKNYSNFGYFANHFAELSQGLFEGEALPDVMLRLTTSYHLSNEATTTAGAPADTGGSAADKLRAYYGRLCAQQQAFVPGPGGGCKQSPVVCPDKNITLLVACYADFDTYTPAPAGQQQF